ncbi:MAG: MFS transporter [Aggregatilineales bacterium]
MTVTQNQTGTSRVKNPWLIMAVICIPVFVGSLDLTIVSAFLPELIVDLELPPQTGLDDAAWILSAYLLAYTVGLAIMGRISDLIGRRAVYAICLIIFIVGSVLVAIAHGAPTDLLFRLYRRMGERPDIAYVELQAIIFGRVVQAFGAGALVPVSLALVGDMFPPQKRARPLGLVGAIDTLGWVLGHLYGGVLVNFFYTNADNFRTFFDRIGLESASLPDWRTLFWINVPLTLFALVATLWALRGVPMKRVKGRFDFLGAGLIVVALVALNVGLGANIDIGGTTSSFSDLSQLPPYALPLLTVFVIGMLLFVLVESRVRDPLFNLKMFRRRNISMGLLSNLFIGYCLFIGLVIVPILVNVRLEDSSGLREAALEVGILLSALTIPMSLATVPGGWLSDRIGYSRTIIAGLSLSVVGFLAIWQTWDMDIGTLAISIQMALVGIGIGLTFSPISASVINSATDDERGAASALVIILRLVGMTISVSSLTTFALQRVTALAVGELGEAGVNVAAYADTYARITVRVLGELGLLGAILCGVAMIPALFMHNRDVTPPETTTTDEVTSTVMAE